MLAEAEATRHSLQTTEKVCKVISIVLKVVFAIVCIFWIIASGFMVYSQVSFATTDNACALKTGFFVLYGLVFAFMFAVFIRMFSSVAKGESPFAMIQVKRLRIIAGLLLLYGVLEIIVSINAPLLEISGMNSGYASTNNNAIIPINLVPFIASFIIFAFSFVFKYGVLLQEFSDETL